MKVEEERDCGVAAAKTTLAGQCVSVSRSFHVLNDSHSQRKLNSITDHTFAVSLTVNMSPRTVLIFVIVAVTCLITPTSPATHKKSDHNQVRKLDRRRLLTNEARISYAITRLAFLILNNLEDEGAGLGNVIYSPLQVTKSLSQLLLASSGKSSQELSKLLGYDHLGLENEAGHLALHDYLNTIKNESSLNSVSAFLVSDTLLVKDEFKRQLQELYHPTLREVDFTSHADVIKEWANNWVAHYTRNHINQLLTKSPAPETQLLILNAIYFNQLWQEQFEPKLTRKFMFYNEGRDYDSKMVDFMRKRFETKFAKLDHLDCKALQLDYDSQSDINMLILLPNDRMGVARLQKSLTAANLNSISAQLEPAMVNVELVKFDINYQLNLKQVMQKLHVDSIFDPRTSNFSQLAHNYDGIAVTDAIHKARIRVDESGTEASAATAILTELRTSSERFETFITSHPFLFIIRVNGVVAFVGRVSQL